MKSFTLSIAVCALLAAADARAITMSWSPVGNPGNLNDGTGFGAVGYSYNIGTYDVTNAQYVEFLNAKDAGGLNTLHLYNANMSNSTFGGINFNSAAGTGNMYSVISGDGNHPVNFVNWLDTLRFANWLNNGQGNGDTESGAYTLLGGTSFPTNANSITRNAGATVFIPSENEWYKAAYNIPGTNSYNLYPTSSNLVPTASVPTGTPNSANYNNAVGNLTDVGAYSGTTSPYGAFDMGGNVLDWNDTLLRISGATLPQFAGGQYDQTSGALSSFQHGRVDSSLTAASEVGFRVASSVPEPSSLVLAALGFIALAACRLGRR